MLKEYNSQIEDVQIMSKINAELKEKINF